MQQVTNVLLLPNQNTWPQTVTYSPHGQLSYAATGTGFAIAPLAEAGPDQMLNDADGNGVETITLDGTASSDADGAIVSYEWSEGGKTIATGVNPQVNLSVGAHTIILKVTDEDGATDTDEVLITAKPMRLRQNE